MICDQLSNIATYKGIHPRLDQGIAFIENLQEDYELGKQVIDGDVLFANVMTYTSKPREEGVYEAHKTYLDIHLILEGEEQLLNAPIQTLQETQAYDESADYLLLDGSSQEEVRAHLKPGNFAICFFEDGHMPGICYEAPMTIKKMVVKIKMD